jgi:hypothetical protein
LPPTPHPPIPNPQSPIPIKNNNLILLKELYLKLKSFKKIVFEFLLIHLNVLHILNKLN